MCIVGTSAISLALHAGVLVENGLFFCRMAAVAALVRCRSQQNGLSAKKCIAPAKAWWHEHGAQLERLADGGRSPSIGWEHSSQCTLTACPLVRALPDVLLAPRSLRGASTLHAPGMGVRGGAKCKRRNPRRWARPRIGQVHQAHASSIKARSPKASVHGLPPNGMCAVGA